MKILEINAVYGFKSTGLIVKDIGETLDDLFLVAKSYMVFTVLAF